MTRTGQVAAGSLPAMSAPSAGPSLRRTWPQRLLIAFNIVLHRRRAGATAYALGYLNQQVGEIDRVRLGDTLDEVEDESRRRTRRTSCIVGADNDEGLDPNDPVATGVARCRDALRHDHGAAGRPQSAQGLAPVAAPRPVGRHRRHGGQAMRINTAVQTAAASDC